MASVRIRVGASLDRSTLTAFEPIVQAAKRARTQVERELAQQAKAADRSQKEQTRAADKEAKLRTRSEKEALREAEREMRRAEHKKKQEMKETTRQAMKEAREREREEKKSIDEVERHRKKADAQMNRRLSQVGQTVGRGILSAGRFAASVGMDLMRGAGVNFDLGTHARTNVSNEQRAVDLSNQAFMPGHTGAAGRRQDPKLIIDNARQVALATATSTDDALEGLQKFVAKTGDLETGQAVLMDMARLSKATGANLSDMSDAAGDVSNALGDVPNKSKLIADSMSLIAAQGKEGAVEIKDLASQMAKVATTAQAFEGNSDKTLKTMGALVQFTRAHGGAASSTQAATSLQSFTNTFGKGARLDAFEKYGVSVKGAGGKVRDPEEIIFDMLRATKGDKRKMSDMVKDSAAQRVTEGFRLKFLENLQTAKGDNEQDRIKDAIAKTREEFDKLKESTMSQEEINTSLTRAMQTQASQAQQLNTQLEAMVAQIQTAVIPALVGLAPVVTLITDAIADTVTALTGQDPRAAVRDARMSELSQKTYDLDTKAKTGTLTSGDLAQGDEVQKQLSAQAAKDKIAADEAKKPRGGLSTTLLDYATGGLGRWVSGKGTLSGAQGEKQQLDIQRTTQDAAESQRKADDLAKHMKEMRDHFKEGPLKVQIVGGATPNLPKQEPSL